LGKPEVIAALGLLLYTVGRFLAAGGAMGRYGVDARWFLFWDIATIPPYVWGIGRLVRGLSSETSNLGQMFIAAGVAIAAFLGPYLYLIYAGAEEFPPLAWILLAVVVLLLAANALIDVRRRVSKASAAGARAN
jgi:hypothetical protein